MTYRLTPYKWAERRQPEHPLPELQKSAADAL